jgi:hypothetical protein
MSTAQRRSKRAAMTEEKTAENASGDTSNDATAAAAQPQDLNDQLQKAMQKVVSNKAATETLHEQWRSYLLHIALMVIVMSFVQVQTPISTCLKEIKAVNRQTNGATTVISWKEAVGFVFQDTMCEWIGICLAASLAYFLLSKRPHDDTGVKWSAAMPYVISSALIPIQLSTYFQTKELAGGCLRDGSSSNEEGRAPNFPVAVIFHVICTAAYFFMKYGIDKCMDNIEMVNDLMQKLEQAKSTSSSAASKRKDGSTKKK